MDRWRNTEGSPGVTCRRLDQSPGYCRKAYAQLIFQSCYVFWKHWHWECACTSDPCFFQKKSHGLKKIKVIDQGFKKNLGHSLMRHLETSPCMSDSTFWMLPLLVVTRSASSIVNTEKVPYLHTFFDPSIFLDLTFLTFFVSRACLPCWVSTLMDTWASSSTRGSMTLTC